MWTAFSCYCIRHRSTHFLFPLALHLFTIGAMVPLLVLALSFVVLRCAGLLGVTALNNVVLPLRIALFLMFLVTGLRPLGKGALSPANMHAAREHLKILGRPAPELTLRGAIQVVFLSALIVVIVRS